MDSSRRPVILDCDPGLDDAVAILLACASDVLDVRAITVVAGNATVSQVLDNCLRLLGYAGIRGVPVAAGCERPLLGELETAGHVHGETGLGGSALPETDLRAVPEHAVDLIARLLRESAEPITLIPTAPMTNIALLVRKEPRLVRERVREIVFMGGATTHGNVTPSAEFNAHTDPEALRIVLQCGVPIVQVGLDVTHKALVKPAHRERMRALGGKVATLVADLMDFYDRHGRAKDEEGAALHDPLAVARVIRPEVLTTRPYHVDVECRGELTRGRTVVDVGGVSGEAPNVQVGVDLDAAGFMEMVLGALARYD